MMLTLVCRDARLAVCGARSAAARALAVRQQRPRPELHHHRRQQRRLRAVPPPAAQRAFSASSTSAAPTACRTPLTPAHLVGHCKDVAEFARTHGVTSIYIALPLSNVPRIGEMIRELRDTTASIYFVPGRVRLRPHPGPAGRDQRHAGDLGLRHALSRHGRGPEASDRPRARKRGAAAASAR